MEKENIKIIETYDYLGKACSATDCTGLIPFAPEDLEQLDSYESLYPHMPAAAPSDTDRR